MIGNFFRYFGKKKEKKFSANFVQPADSEYSGEVSTWRSQDSWDVFTSLATELSYQLEERPRGFKQKRLRTENDAKKEEIQNSHLKADNLRWTKDNLCR